MAAALEEWQAERVKTIAIMAAILEAGDHAAFDQQEQRQQHDESTSGANYYVDRAATLFDVAGGK